jgi:hypothetical protein
MQRSKKDYLITERIFKPKPQKIEKIINFLLIFC